MHKLPANSTQLTGVPPRRCLSRSRPPHRNAAAERERDRAAISRGLPTAVATMGGDGGMNPTFVSALKSHGGPGTPIRTASGTIPAHVHPPADSFPQGRIASVFAITSAEAKPEQVRVASAAPSSSSIGAFFGNLLGSKRDNPSAAAPHAHASADADWELQPPLRRSPSRSAPPTAKSSPPPSRNLLRPRSRKQAPSQARGAGAPAISSAGRSRPFRPEASRIGSAARNKSDD